MRGRRYSEDEITALLREVARRRADGESLLGACKALGISPSSHRRWRKTFGTSAEAGLTRERTDGQTGEQPGARSDNSTPVQDPKLTDEAKKLLDAANTASGAARNAWLAFLALLAYFLVTLAGVSHRDLLLNDPVRLPIVNVEIPLFSFFGFAPVLLLLVYLSLLIQHVILARKYRDYVAAIAPYESQARREHASRQTVHSYVVSQLLAGPKTNLVMNRLMRVMVAVSFVVLPVFALLYFQLKFLPYHDVGVTYWHRIALLLGLAMVLVLLPMMQLVPRKREMAAGPPGLPWRKTRAGIVFGLGLAAAVLGFSWLIATIPDEYVDRQLGSALSHDESSGEWSEESLLNPLVRVVYDRIPYDVRFNQSGWLLDRLLSYRVLIVEDEDMVANKDDPHGEVSVVLRGRDLRFARLNRSDLHRADLTRADLRGAELADARLEDANLKEAKLQGAVLERANLQRANLDVAELQGAILNFAELQDATFEHAQLHNAHLNVANLQGARLRSAKLYGALLGDANLRGANLRGASLHGTELQGAGLQGANLYAARLHGADLRQAKLHSADLGLAELYGAILSDAELDGALVWRAKVWRAEDPPVLPPARPVGLNTVDLDPLADKEKAKLERELARVAKDVDFSSEVRLRLALMVCGATPAWKDEAEWQKLRRSADPDPEEVALFWAETACSDPSGSVAKALARPWRVKHLTTVGSRSPTKLFSEKLLDPNCIGARSLPGDVKAWLRALVAAADAASEEGPSGGEVQP